MQRQWMHEHSENIRCVQNGRGDLEDGSAASSVDVCGYGQAHGTTAKANRNDVSGLLSGVDER